MRMLLVVATCAALLACDGRADVSPTPSQPTPPTEATQDWRVAIELATPNADDGAMLFTITGPDIFEVTARPGLEMHETRTTSNGQTTSTILLRGELASGAVADLRVNAADLRAYAMQVRQVAAGERGGYDLRSDLSGYRLSIQR